MFDGCVCMCAANAKTVSIFFSIFPPSVFVSIRWGPNLLHYLCTSSTIFLGSPVSHTHTVRTRKLYKQNAESNKKSVKIKKNSISISSGDNRKCRALSLSQVLSLKSRSLLLTLTQSLPRWRNKLGGILSQTTNATEVTTVPYRVPPPKEK